MINWQGFSEKEIDYIWVFPDNLFISYSIWTHDGHLYSDTYHRKFGIYNPFKRDNVRAFLKNADLTKSGSNNEYFEFRRTKQ